MRIFRKKKKSASNGKHPHQLPLTGMAYPLEPRIMFDAAIGATGAEVMDMSADAQPVADSVDSSHADPAEVQQIDPTRFVPPADDSTQNSPDAAPADNNEIAQVS